MNKYDFQLMYLIKRKEDTEAKAYARKKKLLILFSTILMATLIDQLTKHWIRLNPELHSMEIIPGWLAFYYTQNPGIALGMNFLPTWAFSLISILIMAGLTIYVLRNIQRATTGYLICMGLILGGALGNIIDRLIMAEIGGYGHILQGRVNDILYITFSINGSPVFPYVFNMADVFITTAIIILLLFHKRILPEESRPE